MVGGDNGRIVDFVFAMAQEPEPMDTSLVGLAEIALKARTAMARQDMAVAMVKQNLQMDQAVVQLLSQATEQATAATSSSGHIVDILV